MRDGLMKVLCRGRSWAFGVNATQNLIGSTGLTRGQTAVQ